MNTHMRDAIAQFMGILLEAEVGHLCGAHCYQHTRDRINYRFGSHRRKLRTIYGDVPLYVPHLRWLHPRVSMLKRFRSAENIVTESLFQIADVGVSADLVAVMIKAVWTIDLPPPLLAELTRTVSAMLEAWRSRITTAANTDFTTIPHHLAYAVY